MTELRDHAADVLATLNAAEGGTSVAAAAGGRTRSGVHLNSTSGWDSVVPFGKVPSRLR
jgi:hypothetical protein